MVGILVLVVLYEMVLNVGISVRGDNQMNESVAYCGLKKEMVFY